MYGSFRILLNLCEILDHALHKLRQFYELTDKSTVTHVISTLKTLHYATIIVLIWLRFRLLSVGVEFVTHFRFFLFRKLHSIDLSSHYLRELFKEVFNASMWRESGKI